MPLSSVGWRLKAQNRLQYGDPCYEVDWESQKQSCRRATGGGGVGFKLLAQEVLKSYGFKTVNTPTPNAWTCCCPLDIFSQDPFAVIKMSLSAKLLDREYWEVYADEFGRARFVKILEGSKEAGGHSSHPPIRYCLRSAKPYPVVDLVIVKSADPPPFRKCGPKINIIPGRSNVLDQRLFDNSALAVKFEWGKVTGHDTPGISPTCSVGIFNQYGTIVYPEYDRKQGYRDGIRDIWEISGFESVLTWLVDVDFGLGQGELRHYSIQFTKSTEIPVELKRADLRITKDLFPPTCDLDKDDEDDCGPETNQRGCSSAKEAWIRSSDSYRYVPPKPNHVFYRGYIPRLDFNETYRWSQFGLDECAAATDDLVDTCYDSTVSLMANGCPLNGFEWHKGDTGYGIDGEPLWTYVNLIDFGQQGEYQTIEIPQDSVWVEIPQTTPDFRRPKYACRFKFPDSTTLYIHAFDPRDGYSPKVWRNAMAPYHGTSIGYRYAGYSGISSCGYYKYGGGTLTAMQEGLFLLKEPWYAKIQVARPGIQIKGAGRAARDLMDRMSMVVWPVYQVDVPGAIGACGKNYKGWVDPYADLRDTKYCTVEDDETEMEKLQAAMTGVTLELSLPFFFPEMTARDSNKEKFIKVSEECQKIACMIYDYLDRYNDVVDKYYSVVCEPPASQAEVPELGKTIS